MMDDNKFQLARPRIHKARPLRLDENVAAVLDEKSIGFAAERGASDLSLLHDHLVGLLHQRQIFGMIEVHNGASNQILRQIAQRTHRGAVHVGDDSTGRVANGELGALWREDFIGNCKVRQEKS